MIVSLYTAATGMNAEQARLDIIANNLANVNSNGYKVLRTEFQDLIYQAVKEAGTPTAQNSALPVGLYIGHGSKLAASTKIFTVGNLEESSNQYDMAIMGDGFFQVQMQDGKIGYTRDGGFKLDANGRLVNTSGLMVVPNLVIPQNATSITVSPDGIVSTLLGDGTTQNLGNVTLVRFINPAGLKPGGANILFDTPASGAPIEGVPGQDGFGTIIQNYIEKSNVDTVKEMVNMIVAQRSYDMNSKTISTADEMLRTVANLKR